MKNLRLLVLCSLAEPYTTSEAVRVAATPERPAEYQARHEYLHVRSWNCGSTTLTAAGFSVRSNPARTGANVPVRQEGRGARKTGKPWDNE
jgi:hypothetical protein